MSGHSLVGHDRLLDVLSVESRALAAAAGATNPELPIPACPGLTVGETARHVGSVYRMAVLWMRSGDRPEVWRREPPAGQSLRDWVRDGARELIDELGAHAPDEPCSTWWDGDRTYGFWVRRMAHEATIHRTDVQAAGGVPAEEIDGDIDDDVAVDGVDEVLGLWFANRLRTLGVSGTREGLVAVRTGGRVWITRGGIGGPQAWHVTETRRADAEVSGSPTRVYRWLWGRLPDSAVHKEGDYDSIAQLWALLRLATR